MSEVTVPQGLTETLSRARSVAVLTGAGISAESGIPTFREAQTGLWAKYDPMELANPEAFARDPRLVAAWYGWRREMISQCEPNAGHRALATVEQRLGEKDGRLTLLTQNVDRLHHQAGSRNVVELHGTLWIWRCTACGAETEEPTVPFPEHPPRCAQDGCGGAKRPAVVWFGEALPGPALEAADRALRECDLLLAVGTSAVVQPAASFVHIAGGHGAATAEINPQETPISDSVDYSVRASASEALDRLLEASLPPGVS